MSSFDELVGEKEIYIYMKVWKNGCGYYQKAKQNGIRDDLRSKIYESVDIHVKLPPKLMHNITKFMHQWL